MGDFSTTSIVFLRSTATAECLDYYGIVGRLQVGGQRGSCVVTSGRFRRTQCFRVTGRTGVSRTTGGTSVHGRSTFSTIWTRWKVLAHRIPAEFSSTAPLGTLLFTGGFSTVYMVMSTVPTTSYLVIPIVRPSLATTFTTSITSAPGAKVVFPPSLL